MYPRTTNSVIDRSSVRPHLFVTLSQCARKLIDDRDYRRARPFDPGNETDKQRVVFSRRTRCEVGGESSLLSLIIERRKERARDTHVREQCLDWRWSTPSGCVRVQRGGKKKKKKETKHGGVSQSVCVCAACSASASATHTHARTHARTHTKARFIRPTPPASLHTRVRDKWPATMIL